MQAMEEGKDVAGQTSGERHARVGRWDWRDVADFLDSLFYLL